jgi:hypothetical protein
LSGLLATQPLGMVGIVRVTRGRRMGLAHVRSQDTRDIIIQKNLFEKLVRLVPIRDIGDVLINETHIQKPTTGRQKSVIYTENRLLF